MKNKNVHTIFIVLFILVLALLTSDSHFKNKYTPDYEVLDQQAYSEQVAEMNRQTNETERDADSDSSETAVQNLYAVMCRSDGRDVSFEGWNPAYVLAGPYDCYTLYFDDEQAAETAAEEISEMDGIRYAEPDGDVFACEEAEYPEPGESEEINGADASSLSDTENETTADYQFHSWGAEQLHLGEYAAYVKQWGTGSNVTVAILDSGIYLHPQLEPRILESGYDYVDADQDSTNDLYGHGTAVAGIVADCTPDGGVYLYPIRVLNATGHGKLSNVVNGVREATEKGVDIINLSLESHTASEALDEAILDAVDAGVTVVVAAGNSSMDTSAVYPAHLTNLGVVVVGAIEEDGTRSNYSNYGSSVDLYAYGTDIDCCSRSGGYTSWSGTSMSAPHVTGNIAMMLQLHPELQPVEIEERLSSAAESCNAIAIAAPQNLIPSSYGFSLEMLTMDLSDEIRMPTITNPVSSAENVTYTSSDGTVVQITDGNLIPVSAGTAQITASATGLGESTFSVLVTEDSCTNMQIAAGIKEIKGEAFLQSSVAHVALPEGLEKLGDHVFDQCGCLISVYLPASLSDMGENSFSDAVLFCIGGSKAEQYAAANGLPYVSATVSP